MRTADGALCQGQAWSSQAEERGLGGVRAVVSVTLGGIRGGGGSGGLTPVCRGECLQPQGPWREVPACLGARLDLERASQL